MKIKKCLVLVICLGGLILSSLPVSFAKDSISPMTSPMSEPVPSYVKGTESDTITLYYVVQWNNSYASSSGSPHYELFEMIFSVSHNSNVGFRVARQDTRAYSSGSVVSSYVVNFYDLQTGNLLGSQTRNPLSFSYQSYTVLYSFADSYFPENNANADICAGAYPILPDGVTLFGDTSSVYNSSPFVTWSQQPLEHNIYHSQLSEPVSDKYNRYFVLDDKLFWVSIRLNGFYVKESDIEGSTGYYQYEAIVPAQGGYENGYSGALAQYSGYIPVNLSSSVFFDDLPFSLSLVADTENWAIRIQSNPLFSGLQTKVDYDLFVSEFNLEDGTYVNSSFTHETQDLLNTAQYALSEPGVFSSVHCYGIDFYNSKNLPINLSDVQWEYDLDFVLWREDVFQKLSDIYDLLSEAESVTSYQAPDLASKMDDENIINDLSYNSGDVQQDLNDNIDRGIQALGSDGGVLQSLSSQIIGLGNGKIFSLLIISLSLGILILILGKNKND